MFNLQDIFLSKCVVRNDNNLHRIQKSEEIYYLKVSPKSYFSGPIWVIIHIYTEMSQGNSLCSYLRQTKISPLFLLQNRIGRWNRSVCGERGWFQWEGEGDGQRVKEDEYGKNTVYTCM
jgi:hypothetical protein